MSRFRTLTAATLVLPLMATVGPGPVSAKKLDPVQALAVSLMNLENKVLQLKREYANPVALTKKFPMQRRYIDARVFFEMGNYEPAAILLHELTERPEFRVGSEYEGALLLLGRCLAKLNNPRGAERYLGMAAAGRYPKKADDARYHLIEVLLNAGRIRQLRAFMQTAPGGGSDRTRYAMGKAWLRLKDYAKANVLLSGIPPISPQYAHSRYYMGVVLTAQKKYKEAMRQFQTLLVLKTKGKLQQRAQDLAHLAIGRLHYELGDLGKAVASYQRVPRTSPSYERALYETAWTYVKRDEYRKALQAVDVLLLLVKDPRLSVRAHVLRGQLSTLLADYGQAVESYKRILDKFAPIRNELNHFTADTKNVGRYFSWLIERYTEGANLRAPLTKRTAQWLEATPSMKRVVRVLGSMGRERRDIRAARVIARDLQRVVSSENRVALFPHLKEGWTRALVLQNRLLGVMSSALNQQYEMVKGQLTGKSRTEIDGMVAYRKDLERRFRKLPMSFDEYEDRQARIDGRYVDLKRKGFLVAQTLKLLRKQLQAIEEQVNRKQFADQGKKFTSRKEKVVRTEIAAEKTRLEKLYKDLERLRDEIKAQSNRIGVGDSVTKRERNLKLQLVATMKREGLEYERLASRVTMGRQKVYSRFGGLRERVFRSFAKLRDLIKTIDKNVREKSLELKALIAREQRSLENYRKEMKGYQISSRAITDKIGKKIFKRAHRQMKKVVLGADVGLIDVAWRRKTEQTKKIEKLAIQKSRKLDEINRESQRLMREAGKKGGKQ